jgi:hypothetical protein
MFVSREVGRGMNLYTFCATPFLFGATRNIMKPGIHRQGSQSMKTILVIGACAASLTLGACATNRGATAAAVGHSDAGSITVKDGKRQDALVGSRLARETRENSESVKSMGRKGYKEAQMEKSGAPLEGQNTGM